MLTAVVDADISVSSLLSPKGWSAKIIDLVLGDQIQVAYDDRILGVYDEVLSQSELHIPPIRMLAVIDCFELTELT